MIINELLIEKYHTFSYTPTKLSNRNNTYIGSNIIRDNFLKKILNSDIRLFAFPHFTNNVSIN